jgi:hypothetical protein
MKDIDTRCQNVRGITFEAEIIAHESISKGIIQEMRPFSKHKSFQKVIEDFVAPKLSIVKVGFDLIMEELVKRLVRLKLYEKRIQSLENENKIYKTIIMSEELSFIVNEHLVNFMNRKRAQKAIAKSWKKFQWRKKIALSDKRGVFDWKRVRAGIGKEYLQILFKQCESTMGRLAEVLLDTQPNANTF